MTKSDTATQAIMVWNESRRRRARSALADRAADGALAAGALLVSNAALPLGLTLPDGGTGISLGASLVLAALTWMTRGKRRLRAPRPAPAAVLAMRRAA